MLLRNPFFLLLIVTFLRLWSARSSSSSCCAVSLAWEKGPTAGHYHCNSNLTSPCETCLLGGRAYCPCNQLLPTPAPLPPSPLAPLAGAVQPKPHKPGATGGRAPHSNKTSIRMASALEYWWLGGSIRGQLLHHNSDNWPTHKFCYEHDWLFSHDCSNLQMPNKKDN